MTIPELHSRISTLALPPYKKSLLLQWVSELTPEVRTVEVKTVEVKTVEVEKIVPQPILGGDEPVNLITVMAEACQMYGVDMDKVLHVKHHENRKGAVLSAAVYFCRKVKMMNRYANRSELARFLNVDHTTVLFYLYRCKVDCAIGMLGRG
jgi:hypothetical protein